MPAGSKITRQDHNLGKIHDADVATFELAYHAADAKGGFGPLQRRETLAIRGSTFRKIGLGKDVTDKFLAGLPGVQKEGCDGIITSARFILHRMPPAIRTVCMEFFGQVRDSTPAIVEIKRYLDQRPGGAILAGLEHLDERYVKAVGYATKAKRHGRPKMVLIGDIVGEDEDAVARAASEVVRLCNARGAEGFVATSPETRKKFWLDRARTAAIAAHTNAFKINEDVVIPLDRLGDYTDGIERINIELSIGNKLALCDALEAALAEPFPPALWGAHAEELPPAGDPCREARRSPYGHRRRAHTMAGFPRPHRADVSGIAGAFGCRVVEERDQGATGGRFRRHCLRARAQALHRCAPGGAARARVRRAAYACWRWQRAQQHSGEFG